MDQNNQNKNIQNSLSDNSSLATLLLSLTNNNTGMIFDSALFFFIYRKKLKFVQKWLQKF